MTAKEHNKLVGIFLMAHGALQGFAVLIISLVYGVMGAAFFAAGQKNEEKMVGLVFIVVMVMVVIFSLAFVLPQILGGWKLYKERANARIWGIVGSCLSVISFPLGTAAGVYGLWFLFGDEGKRFYENPPQQNYLGEMNAANDFQANDYREREPHSWK